MEVKPKTRKYREFEHARKEKRMDVFTNPNIEYSDERHNLTMRYTELTDKIEYAKKNCHWDNVKILRAEQKRIEDALTKMQKTTKKNGLFGGLFKK